MTAHDTPETQQAEALRLLRRIDNRLDVIERKVDDVPQTAMRYGVAAGGVAGAATGGLVSAGIAFARAKLGL